MPRLIDADECPHCKAELPAEIPRSCPKCGGSLQQRYLKSGCLSSAPKAILFALGAWFALRELVA
jgi:predicted amidophosphoribosyltransferase